MGIPARGFLNPFSLPVKTYGYAILLDNEGCLKTYQQLVRMVYCKTDGVIINYCLDIHLIRKTLVS